ncbi:Scavenger receptor cysteine-rich domain superfamily protein, partial [Trichoplax sp. H2]
TNITIPIRLVNGYKPNAGRLEVFYNNQWGSVCHREFGIEDARVVCRQLGYTNVSSYYCCSYFGYGNGPIWLSNVNCTGSESSLSACSYTGWNNTGCQRYDEAGIECTVGACGSFPCVHGTCISNATLGVGYNCSCSPGWTGKQCEAGTNECASNPCSSNATCVDQFQAYTCKCPEGYYGSNCAEGPVAEGALRLVGKGYDSTRGNVQIYHDGRWGAICDHGWSMQDAQVACRQLGFANVSTYQCCSQYGSARIQIWLRYLGCTGNETSLLQCSRSNWTDTGSCNNYNYAGVTCLTGSCASYPCVHGTCTSNSTGGYNCSCSYGWTGQQCQMSVNECASNPCSANATCIDQHTSYVCLCPDGYYGSNCQEGPIADGSVRLVAQYNAAGPNEGNVEIYHNGTWGSICHRSFDINDAQVVCRQLGYPNASHSYCCSYYGNNKYYTLMWLSNLYCRGNESRVSDCSRGSGWGSISNGCSRYDVA